MGNESKREKVRRNETCARVKRIKAKNWWRTEQRRQISASYLPAEGVWVSDTEDV